MLFSVPSLLLKQLYTFGSLKNVDQGVKFSIKNRLSDATITDIQGVSFDGTAVPIEAVTIDLVDGSTVTLCTPVGSSSLNSPLARVPTSSPRGTSSRPRKRSSRTGRKAATLAAATGSPRGSLTRPWRVRRPGESSSTLRMDSSTLPGAARPVALAGGGSPAGVEPGAVCCATGSGAGGEGRSPGPPRKR